MELMSSSEDEGDSPASMSASPARPKRLPVANSQDSLEDELLSPSMRTKAVNKPSAERKTVRDRPTGHKPVISAHELLMNFLPTTTRRPSPAINAKDATVDAAVAAYSLVTPNKAAPPARASAQSGEQKEERELTAGERIARKYGLVAAAKTPSKETPTRGHSASSSTATRPTATSRSIGSSDSATPRRETASPVQQPVEKSKKRSFWDDQIIGADTEQPAQKTTTYVSPFSDPNGFMNMKKRRQRRQQPMVEMSEEEMKNARDTFYDDSKSEAQDVGPRPRHIIGSAIPEVDDADEWMSDSKEVVSEDEEIARKQVAAADAETLSAPRRAGRTVSRQTTRDKRVPSKRPVRKRLPEELSDSSEDEKEAYTSERWPQLDPPKVDAGPMVLTASEQEGAKPLEVCANLNSYLFDYQRGGVEFLYSAYQRDTGAILGDDMGLGKTIQVIAFLSVVMGKYGDRRDKDAWKVLLHQRRERYSNTSGGHPEDIGFSFAGEIAPIFIVMPASLLQNWEHELHTWMSCSTIILRGKPSERDAMIDQIARGEYEIVICSYDILKMYLARLHKIPWEMVILDEMHCLKNPEAQLTKAVKAIKCKRKLGLTGTLMQNNEKELHCLVDTIAPGAIGSWAEFSMYYGNDIKYGRKKSAAPEAVKRSRQKEKELRKKLRPYYLRREKEINPTFQEVKKSDQVVFCDLTPLQMAAYERVLAMPEFELLRRGEENCDCGRDSKEKRKKCCYKIPTDLGDAPGLLYERFHENGACKNCPNCMGLPCVAMLLKLSNHLELLKVNPHDASELQHYQAEFARTAFGDDLDVVGGVNQVSSFQEMCAISTKTCGKMIVLEKLLAVWKKRKERTLIFSRSTRMLDIIQLFLITKTTRYSRLDGNTKVEERLQMVNDFNSPDSNTTVFLISTRAGGVGLNLQSATNVVIFDPSWNPAHDCQAQDRAYRIGQTKDVQVYRLITLGTIEEMIYVRQIYKQQLSDTTLKGANAPRYFEGVQGNPQQRGELFGIANLIYWKPGGVLKGIQDAYQRSRDGLIIQQNRVQYNAAAMRKPTKKSTPKMQLNVVDDDEGEMIEVADELVSDMLSAEELPTQPPIEEKRTALSSDSGDDDDMDALLNGATTFRHEEIVGEQDDEQETYHLEGNTAVIDESESEQDDTASREALEHGEQAQPTPVKSRGSILSRMKDVKSPNGESTPDRSDQKRIYVPTYL
ncbi:Switch 2 [Phytophthora fragariae]|uniref:Switch 2 n=2 Tax=Phytophthora fragariae TaxID=53985 RepID=A0A6A3LID2_9STRA|nr:Switch 2 [Phytophthora fragariae]KAE9128458.1 Switch 2 [Phytophthora fragariae]KAE9222684.1 Switch 2 [Phytophthora fragariae]KAE9243317.1 Switch 2 [Phytophthora fragariae]